VERINLRSRREVIARCRTLATELRDALAGLPDDSDNPAVIEALWRGEALGTLLWALDLVDMPPYDEPFDPEALFGLSPSNAQLLPAGDIERAREAARLWHWRARTTLVADDLEVELPERWQSFDQLVAATAMRAHGEGLVPEPVRGDFPAFGKVYRHLTPDEHAEALAIAFERHYALSWLCGLGKSWETVPTDT
jgi:hypothetical protein